MYGATGHHPVPRTTTGLRFRLAKEKDPALRPWNHDSEPADRHDPRQAQSQ